MPLVFRSMDRDGDLPAVGATATSLGVRVPEDLMPEDGNVGAEFGGMSVSPSVEALPLHRQPKWLLDVDPNRFYGARGASRLAVWNMGNGPFERCPIDERLVLVPDKPSHGVYAPAYRMTIKEFQEALAATKEDWKEWQP